VLVVDAWSGEMLQNVRGWFLNFHHNPGTFTLSLDGRSLVIDCSAVTHTESIHYVLELELLPADPDRFQSLPQLRESTLFDVGLSGIWSRVGFCVYAVVLV